MLQRKRGCLAGGQPEWYRRRVNVRQDKERCKERYAMVKIVIPDDFPPVISGTPALARLQELGEVTVYTSRPDTEAELIQRIQGAHTVVNIRGYSKFGEAVLRACPTLKHLAIWGTGTDNVDLEAAARLGITVTNTPNTATEAIAEHCIALMLAVARNLIPINMQMRQGEWKRGMLTQLYGKTLGIIGTGVIGTRTAELGKGLGMEVIAWTFHPDPEKARRIGFQYIDSLDDLLQQSDVVSLHLRLSPQTERLINAEKLALMKPTAIFINTARGAIVDQQALYQALKAGKLAGAGLDVFVQEPIDPQDPLLQLSNVVLTPHTAGTTPEALQQGLNMAAENVAAFLQGTVQNRVV
ncbi:MAG: glycerate dehydrogenase [Nitrospinota bacterium]|nr:MAG: glycerate dehydrogenase [Nitrospinota bacterium]